MLRVHRRGYFWGRILLNFKMTGMWASELQLRPIAESTLRRYEITESLKLATRAVAAHVERPDVLLLRDALAELSARITALRLDAAAKPDDEHFGARVCAKACIMAERAAHKLCEAEAIESELRVRILLTPLLALRFGSINRPICAACSRVRRLCGDNECRQRRRGHALADAAARRGARDASSHRSSRVGAVRGTEEDGRAGGWP